MFKGITYKGSSRHKIGIALDTLSLLGSVEWDLAHAKVSIAQIETLCQRKSDLKIACLIHEAFQAA